MLSKRKTVIWAGLMAATTLLAGCGGGEGGEGLSGSVNVDGSSTVYPITEAVAEEFLAEHPDVRVPVGISGTGGGFKRLAQGSIAIADASRPIKQSEIENLQQAGIGFIELPVAYDGLAVVVNPNNDWVDYLTVEELEKIWGPGSEVDSWDDVRPGWPNVELKLFAPGTDSGTFDYFTEAVMGESGASRADYTASEDDNVLVQGVAGERGAMGYFGYAYYAENQGRLKVVPIKSGEKEPVIPTEETISNGTYEPLSRPLFIYVRENATERPEVDTFVKFYLNNAGGLAREVGYVELPERAYELAMARYENRVTGSMFTGGPQIGVKLEDLLKAEEAALQSE